MWSNFHRKINSMHFYDHHAYIVLCLSVVCPIPPIPGVQWEIEGKLTCPNAIPGAQSHVLSPYNASLSNTPYLPAVHSVWKGDMGVWIGQSRLSTHPSGKILAANSPFTNICPRFAMAPGGAYKQLAKPDTYLHSVTSVGVSDAVNQHLVLHGRRQLLRSGGA